MPDRLRVLHVYAGNLYGGVERMLATLAGTRVDGLEQAFALAFDGRLAGEIRRAGAPLDVVGPVRASRPWTAIGARRKLAGAIRAHRPDVVVCHSSWAHGIFGPVARKQRTPLVFWLHDAVAGTTWADRLARRTRPELAICTSRFAATTLDRLWPHLPAEVVYPPVPAPSAADADRERARAEFGVSADDVVILMASRMEPWKGHRVLLEALSALRDESGWTCWIAGGASRPHEQAHLAEMRAVADRGGIAPRVRFLGERADVPRLMAAADLLCQPNTGPEPFGIAFVEAMYAGLPVVATALGGAREVIDRATGTLVRAGDVAGVAEALRALIADTGLRERLGAAGPIRARALCCPHQQAERMRQVLASVAAGQG